MDTAISLAKKRMGIPNSMKVYIKEYPQKKDDLQSLLKLFGINKNDDEEVKIDLASAMTKYFGNDFKAFLPVYNSLPEGFKSQIQYMINILKISEKQKVMMALPDKIVIE
jgi:hypothetical protein